MKAPRKSRASNRIITISQQLWRNFVLAKFHLDRAGLKRKPGDTFDSLLGL